MSRFLEKLRARNADLNADPVRIAFLGDSVTQGCFEIYRTGEAGIETVFEPENAYSACLRKIFAAVCPRVPVAILNCGISGDNAPHGLQRLEKDVLTANPDLVVVCFGLNDSGAGPDGLERYAAALRGILARLRKEGIDAVLLTPNMMCRRVDCRITDELERRIAAGIVPVQNDGVLDAYMDAARAAAAAEGARLCDCYALWKAMDAAGMDTTAMLSNHINHPSRELHWMFAWKLFETIVEG